jgi:hypothetical protein
MHHHLHICRYCYHPLGLGDERLEELGLGDERLEVGNCRH